MSLSKHQREHIALGLDLELEQLRKLAMQSKSGGGGGSSSGSITIQDEGTTVMTGVQTLDFIGATIVAARVGSKVTITVDGATPGGSDGQIQYNDNGSLGASAGFVFDAANTRVGIGTDTPGYDLEISKSAGNAQLALRSSGGSGKIFSLQSKTDGSLVVRDSSAGVDRITILTSGLIGIGGTPVYDLHVIKSSGNASITVQADANSAESRILIDRQSNSTSGGAAFVGFSTNAPGSPTFQIGLSSGSGVADNNLYIGNNGFVQKWFTFTTGGLMGINLPTGDSPEGYLSFSAAESNTPTIRFQNSHSFTGDAAITTYDTASATEFYMGSNAYVNNAGSIVRFNTSSVSSMIGLANGAVRILAGGTGANPATIATFASTGRLGIGSTKTNPLAMLDIEGSDTLMMKVRGTATSQAYISLANDSNVSWDFVIGGSASSSTPVDSLAFNRAGYHVVFLSNGNVSIGGANPNFQSGVKAVVYIANATTVPTGDPSGGGFLYSESGALKWRGSSGTITTLGAA